MKKIIVLENLFRSLIASEIKLSTILVALQNACIHGESLEEAGWNVSDESLEALFAGFDISTAASQEME